MTPLPPQTWKHPIPAALRLVWPLRRSAQLGPWKALRHQAAAAQMITMGGRAVHLAHWAFEAVSGG